MIDTDDYEKSINISEEELIDFIDEYREVLPDSIIKWEMLFKNLK